MQTWRKTSVAVTVLFVGSAGVGCGGADKPFKTARLAGTVKIDGESIENGTISFVPEDGQSPTTGAVIQGGKYAVEVPLGRTKILISAVRGTGRMQKAYDTPDSPTMEITEEVIPARYNVATTLEHDVTEKKSDLDFDLNR